MANNKNFFSSFSDFMDQNIRGVQYGLYSTALVGLAVALRSIRPFKKFTTPQSLPASFLQKHVKLRGRVIGVEAPGLLQIEHFPIFSIVPRKSEPITVGVDSIRVMGHGMSWLQTVINNQEVTFIPISADSNVLNCIVIRTKKNVGVQLVSLGMAKVEPFRINLKEDLLYKHYYQELLHAENTAERKRLGLWADEPPPPSVLSRAAVKTVDIVQKGFQKGYSSLKWVPSKLVH